MVNRSQFVAIFLVCIFAGENFGRLEIEYPRTEKRSFFQLAQELESGKLVGAMRGMLAAASLLLLAVLLYGSASRSAFQPTMVAGPPMTYAGFRFPRQYVCTAIPA